VVEVTRRGHALLHRLNPDGLHAVEHWLYPLTDRSIVDAGFAGYSSADRARDAAS
jgi:hypothetical protein